MKKSIQASLAALALVGAVGAQAESFEVAANTAFTEYFTFTPTETNKAVIAVSGLGAQFSSLSFELSTGPTVVASVKNGNLIASFNDFKNSAYSLLAGMGYTLKVTGQSKPSLPGTVGLVSITTAKADISPVPEPESYAMFLAGLGLMAAIARRRSNKA